MTKIILIDDDRFITSIYTNKFRELGFEVSVAHDGEAALELIKDAPPDIVLLDLMLPKLSGIEVLRRLRAERTYGHIPVVVLSNAYLKGLAQEAWSVGATKVITKMDHSPKQVMKIVQDVLAEAIVSSPVPDAVGTASLENVGVHADDDFHEELRLLHFETAPALLQAGVRLLRDFVRSPRDIKLLYELYRKIHAVAGRAGMAEIKEIATLASALEALLKEIYQHSNQRNPSTLRTVAQALDLLMSLHRTPSLVTGSSLSEAKILIVDDDLISLRALSHSLGKTKFVAVCSQSPEEALELLTHSAFDLVFMDVQMPGVTGFEAYSRMRNLPLNHYTPVIFITSATDFETRVQSTLSGGNDLISKPFIYVEVALKALMLVLRARLCETSPSLQAA